MRRVCLGADWRHVTIFLEFFGQVSLGAGEIRNFELVGVGEKRHWSENGVDISFQDLVHNFEFADVSLKVRRIGRARG